MNKSFVESLKEGLRLALFGAVAYIVTFLLQYFGAMDQNEIITVVLTFVLRLADKFLHEQGVAGGLSKF